MAADAALPDTLCTLDQEATPGRGDPACDEEQQREWTRWSDQRPPNARGSFRYRATFPFLGLTVTAEWTEEMHLCGMGYADSEWWPLSPCYWDGYRRYITIANLEWSPVQAYDPETIVWHGLDLLPCPFTGKPPKVEATGQYIGAPLWRSEAVWISSPSVPKRRFTDAKKMVTAWNTRSHLEAGWQPIEQAPKDGTLLDLWVVYTADDGWSAGERVTECRWRNESATYYEGWQNSFGNLIEWSQKDERTGAEYGRKVTHFRPLPAPPSIPHPPAGESDRG